MKRGNDDMMDASKAAVTATVLCYSCGVPIVANETMRCAQCLQAEVSIVDGIPRQVALPHCRNCDRYLKPSWVKCELESRELLGVCLGRVKGLGKEVRLVDAAFIWTEEHSRRIKVKITVQKEVAANSILQQKKVIEFQVINQQCEDCKRTFTPHSFNAIVQVRQKVAHRRSFILLEQLILKHDAHAKVVCLKENREGLDFMFGQRSHAQRFSDFIGNHVPTKIKTSKHLVSHDANSNVYNYKYTLMSEICPICQDDLVYVPRGHMDLLSGASPLMLCHKVSTEIRLVDPLTLRSYDIPNYEYWKKPLEPVATRSHLTEYVVLNIEEVALPEVGTRQKHHLAGREKMRLGDIEVARVSDLGTNDERKIVRSHMAGSLRPGNFVYGYNLSSINISGLDSHGLDMIKADVILVRRSYKKRKNQNRAWELRRMEREEDPAAQPINDDEDMEAVKQDLEEYADLRRHVNMYSRSDNSTKAPQAPNEDEDDEDVDDDAPEVPLAELLEGLTLRDPDVEAEDAACVVNNPFASAAEADDE